MTYRELKVHCDGQACCADCRFDGCMACKDQAPYQLPDDDPCLDMTVSPAFLRPNRTPSKRRYRAGLTKLAATLLGAVVGVALAIALCEGIKLVMPTPVATKEPEPQSMFVEVESTINWYVVYHRETRVMYAVSKGGAVFTLLMDADGQPLLYNE